MDSKYEHAKFLIERFDHYFDTINNKGAFYIGLNTFILGGLCIGYTGMMARVAAGFLFWSLLIFIFCLCLISIVYTIKAITPYMKDNQSNDDNASLVYFGGIAKHELNYFIEKFQAQNEAAVITDMTRQAHCLAMGLDQKFRWLKTASICLIGQFIFIVFLFIYITQNIKP